MEDWQEGGTNPTFVLSKLQTMASRLDGFIEEEKKKLVSSYVISAPPHLPALPTIPISIPLSTTAVIPPPILPSPSPSPVVTHSISLPPGIKKAKSLQNTTITPHTPIPTILTATNSLHTSPVKATPPEPSVEPVFASNIGMGKIHPDRAANVQARPVSLPTTSLPKKEKKRKKNYYCCSFIETSFIIGKAT